MFYHYSSNGNLKYIYNKDSLINVYYGITQDPITQDFMFIMPYYNSDLMHFINKGFYNISWYDKISKLQNIIDGLAGIHKVNIIHRDLHSGNILLDDNIYPYYHQKTKICDLGTSRSATENDDNNDNEDNVYGIIPYVAPEVLQGKCIPKLQIYIVLE
jgi:serine/threonine protein kinase